MKKNLFLILGLSAIILLAGCGGKEENVDIENIDAEDTGANIIATEEDEYTESIDPSWVATSLTAEDLDRIEETMPPLSYNYETYDMSAQAMTNSGSYTFAEGETPSFNIPEYATMVSREVTSSGIEDDMIYTSTNVTLEDGSILYVLYVNEPDTLFCRAISIQNGDLATLYSNFVYAADVE